MTKNRGTVQIDAGLLESYLKTPPGWTISGVTFNEQNGRRTVAFALVSQQAEVTESGLAHEKRAQREIDMRAALMPDLRD